MSVLIPPPLTPASACCCKATTPVGSPPPALSKRHGVWLAKTMLRRVQKPTVMLAYPPALSKLSGASVAAPEIKKDARRRAQSWPKRARWRWEGGSGMSEGARVGRRKRDSVRNQPTLSRHGRLNQLTCLCAIAVTKPVRTRAHHSFRTNAPPTSLASERPQNSPPATLAHLKFH